jgi:isoleucyl-tRNA synthetase
MNITRNKKSVHLSKFPIYNFNCLNMSLEKKMNFVKIIISLVHSLRKKHGLRVRQILSEVLLIDFNRDLKFNLLDFHKVILSEINVKKIKYVKSSSLVLSKKIKFNFRNSGKIYGIYVKEFLLIFKKISFNFVNFFEKNYYFLFRLKNKFIKISLANILIYSKYIDKFSIISKNSITIGLNINISLLLKKHGFIRDFISKIQNIRKKMMLSVQSKIKILISLDNSFLCNFIIKNSLYICNEVQSERLELTNEILKNVDFISFNNTILNFEIKLSKF